MPNPNNKTAQIYDIFTKPLKGEEITNKEISLINFLAEPGSTILDIGAGTGRHALTLAEQGYKVTAIDSSKEMLAVLNSKFGIQNSTFEVVNKDILTYHLPPNTYNLIILMWNSFNEIALTKKDAIKLLRNLKRSLTDDGKILINIDDAAIVNPAKFNFETQFLKDGLIFKQSWKTVKFNKKTNTSTSKEVIEVINETNKVIDRKVSEIRQRYWSIEELEKLCQVVNLDMKVERIKESEELYVLLINN